ncbi:MAG TPA: OmpA family protein [Flavobacteriales bacterium]
MKLYHKVIGLVVVGLVIFSSPAIAQFTTEKAIDSTRMEIEDQKMRLLVLDSKTKKSMEADVRVRGLNPRKTVVFKNLSDTTLSLKKYRIYTVSVVKSGYMYHTHTFWPDESSEHIERIELRPIAIGAKASPDITFLGDDTQIYHKSTPALEELVEFMKLNPTVRIAVIGHANGPAGKDQKSSSFYKKATEKRAQAVIDYLVSHGIAKERMEARGAGNTQMIYPDPKTDWQVEANRRVEIEIIEK